MNKETKILVGVGAVIAAYLIFKPKKAVAQTYIVSTPKIVQSSSKVQTPSNVQLENMPIVKQTPFAQIPVIEKEPIIDYTNYKRPPSYKMTDVEWAACQKNLKDCKF